MKTTATWPCPECAGPTHMTTTAGGRGCKACGWFGYMADIKRPAWSGATTVSERLALVPEIERALFGTEDGGRVADDADLPVGELRRLLREVWAQGRRAT